MNYKPLLVILIFGLFYTNAQQKSEISFKEVKHKYGCRNCYGSLVVKKGSFSDTIYGGQWGNSVNYKLIKIKDKEYLNTYYRYGYPGGHAVLKYKIHSIEEQNFLEPIFEKSFSPRLSLPCLVKNFRFKNDSFEYLRNWKIFSYSDISIIERKLGNHYLSPYRILNLKTNQTSSILKK